MQQVQAHPSDQASLLETSIVAPTGRARHGAAKGRSVLVAATGGHLTQLMRLSERIDLLGEPLWVTFDGPQSQSMLRPYDKAFVRFTAPRDYRSVAHNLPDAYRILRRFGALEVLSTGSAVALSFLPMARMLGIPCHYIESAARSTGPSVTGRTLSRIPGVKLYSQYPEWATGNWNNIGSLFDEYAPEQGAPVTGELSVVVTLGTLSYPFGALVEAVKRAAQPDWNIFWQLGPNEYGPLPGEAHSMIDAEVLAEKCANADVVIGHSGVGSALLALDTGHHPVLMARDHALGEHVDDHQRLIGEELHRRGLATLASADQITPELIREIASRQVVRTGSLKPLELKR